MSECKICRDHGFPSIMIAWDNNIKTKAGRFVPLELDKTTPHKHYESNTITTTTSKKLDLDLDNLDVIKLIAAALNEYIAIKEEK